MNFKIIFIIITIIIIIFIGIFLRILSLQQTTPQPIPSSSSYPIPYTSPAPNQNDYSQQYIDQMEKILIDQKKSIDKNQQVGKLLEKMPYSGKFFTLKFDFEKANFIVTFNLQKRTEAEEEFDDYLKNQGIEDRSWIDNLVTIIQ